MKLINKKICIVTGAAGGIGSEICKLFAENGAEKIIAVEHTKGSVEKWKSKFKDKSLDSILPYTADITNDNDIRRLVQHVKKQYGRIDVLINTAGVEYNERIGMIDFNNMNHMFDVNVFGTIKMMQYVSRIMISQKQGAIINVSSVVGVYGNAGQSVYSATKGAIISLTKSASKELAHYGIRVNAVAPGITDTEMLKSTSKEAIDGRVSNVSLGRLAKPSEIADVIIFLSSEMSSFITGQVVGVDGGTIM